MINKILKTTTNLYNFTEAAPPFRNAYRKEADRHGFLLGEHLFVQRRGFTHHGIYIGDQCVMHYLRKEGVRPIKLKDFRSDGDLFIRKSIKIFDNETIALRAWEREGESDYSVFNNNCEHFCIWCRSGLIGLDDDLQSTIDDVLFNRFIF